MRRIARGRIARGRRRHLHAARRDDVLEVGEDALRGLGAEVRDGRRVGERADVRLEHQVEVARRRERAGLAGGGRRDQTLLVVGRLGEVLELGQRELALLLRL